MTDNVKIPAKTDVVDPLSSTRGAAKSKRISQQEQQHLDIRPSSDNEDSSAGRDSGAGSVVGVPSDDSTSGCAILTWLSSSPSEHVAGHTL